MIVPRAGWGARPPRGVVRLALPLPDVWLHHTAGNEPDGPEGVRRVQDYHMNVRGYVDIAYSFVVDRQGTVFEGRGAGVAGAHTRGHNRTSHAICVLGHYDRQHPTDEATAAVAWLLRHGQTSGWWPDPELTGGHRNVGSTSCPGTHLYALIPDINRLAEDPMPTHPVAVVADGDVDNGAAQVAAVTYSALLGLHVPVLTVAKAEGDVGHAILIGAAGRQAAKFPSRLVLTGENRRDTGREIARRLGLPA